MGIGTLLGQLDKALGDISTVDARHPREVTIHKLPNEETEIISWCYGVDKKYLQSL